MRIIKKAGTVIMSLLFCMILMTASWIIISQHVLHQQPSFFGYSPVTVLSGSMEPVFSAGDVILIKEASDYKTGDIVTFQSEGALITHRIVEETANGYVTQGDANNIRDDEIVTKDQIIGIYIMAIPLIGVLKLWMMKPIGIISILMVLAIIYVIRRKRKIETEVT